MGLLMRMHPAQLRLASTRERLSRSRCTCQCGAATGYLVLRALWAWGQVWACHVTAATWKQLQAQKRFKQAPSYLPAHASRGMQHLRERRRPPLIAPGPLRTAMIPPGMQACVQAYEPRGQQMLRANTRAQAIPKAAALSGGLTTQYACRMEVLRAVPPESTTCRDYPGEINGELLGLALYMAQNATFYVDLPELQWRKKTAQTGGPTGGSGGSAACRRRFSHPAWNSERLSAATKGALAVKQGAPDRECHRVHASSADMPAPGRAIDRQRCPLR